VISSWQAFFFGLWIRARATGNELQPSIRNWKNNALRRRWV
jgi:hypothetical protein